MSRAAWCLLLLFICGCVAYIKGKPFYLTETMHFNACEGTYQKDCIVTRTGDVSNYDFVCNWSKID